jgi:RNA polymerase sigma-70 factor (ECF subfamily)
MARWDSVSDVELLRASRRDAQAFATFYARHERRLLSYLMRRTRSGELAADLCAETFAVALEACRAGRPMPAVPVAWLFGIANHKLADGVRRARVGDRARRALEMRAIELTRRQISQIEQLCGEAEATALLRDLPIEQRDALLAYIVDERAYGEIAAELRCSESVVRKRVSRGLAALRVRLQESR